MVSILEQELGVWVHTGLDHTQTFLGYIAFMASEVYTQGLICSLF